MRVEDRALVHDPLAVLTRLHALQAETVGFGFGRQEVVYAGSPTAVEELLVRRAGDWERVVSVTASRVARTRFSYGMPLLGSPDPQTHRHARRTLQPAFTRERIAETADTIVALAEAAVDGWGEEIDAGATCGALTAAISAGTLFRGTPLDAVATTASLDAALAGFRPFSTLGSTIAAAGRAAGSARAGVELVSHVGAALHDVPVGDGRTAASQVLAAAEGHLDDPGAVAREAIGVFAASSETTSRALTWALGLVAGHPDVAERIRDETVARAPGRSLGGDDAEQLPYTRAVMAETLRLYPPAWVVARRARVATELAGRPVREGTVAAASSWASGRDERWWPDATRFHPERFLTAAPGRPRYAVFPFGGGVRQCIGERLAWLEGVLVLGTVLRRVRLTPSGPLPAAHAGASLEPAGPLLLQVRRRDGVGTVA